MGPSVEQCEDIRYYEANRIIRESISSLPKPAGHYRLQVVVQLSISMVKLTDLS